MAPGPAVTAPSWLRAADRHAKEIWPIAPPRRNGRLRR